MLNLETMGAVLDFVEDHLHEAITIADMAEAVAYSLFHFCRVFNETTHNTPYDYLIRRRLSLAANQVVCSERKITEIALDYQFNSPEGFTRAFRRMFGVQPSAARKARRLDLRLLMPRLTIAHLAQIACGQYLRPVVESLPELALSGVMGIITTGEAEVQRLWGFLEGEAGLPLAISDCWGMVYTPHVCEFGEGLYLAGVAGGPAAQSKGDLMAPPLVDFLVYKSIPAQTWVRFIHKGPRCNRKLSLDYVYGTWLPRSQARLASDLVLEHYRAGRPRPEDPQAEFELYFPVDLTGIGGK